MQKALLAIFLGGMGRRGSAFQTESSLKAFEEKTPKLSYKGWQGASKELETEGREQSKCKGSGA